MERVKQEKGVAGLTILLSVISMLFVIGLLVMIFALMGGELQDATRTASDVTTATNETDGFINGTTYTVDQAVLKDFVLVSITEARNESETIPIVAANYSFTSAGVITNATTWTFANVNFTYTYTYTFDNARTNIISNTTDALGDTIDWFDIFIIITAMVVLILLVTIIIASIKSTGLMQDGSGANKRSNIGSA